MTATSGHVTSFRLLVTRPMSGASNMAIDEALWRSRQSGATPSTNPLDDWTANNTDKANTYGLGGTLAVIPQKLALHLLGRFQRVNGFADLFSPPGGTPDIAVPIPNVDDTKLWTASAELTWRSISFTKPSMRSAAASGTAPRTPVKAIKNAVRVAAEWVRNDVNQHIKTALEAEAVLAEGREGGRE